MNEEHDSTRERKKSRVDDAEEIREVFGALNEAIPKLISGLLGSVYSPEAAGSVATAIGTFYTKLIEQGIPKETALEMTKGYVAALDFGRLMSMATESKGGRGIRVRIDEDDDDDDDDDDDEDDE